MINSTGYTQGTINSNSYTLGSINSTGETSSLIRANSTVVLAGSVLVLANGIDTSSSYYDSGNLIIKSTDWTQT